MDPLPLFHGPHIAAVRFERAMEALDLAAAEADCPEPWRPALAALRTDLLGARVAGWPEVFERTWQRLVGRRLDAHGIPGVFAGEPAGAFLRRGGERERAEASLRRHVDFHPTDVAGWREMCAFEPLRAGVRLVFHGGETTDAVRSVEALIEEDDLAPSRSWILAYAWLASAIDTAEVAAALAAEHVDAPLPLPGDGVAFAWYLVALARDRGAIEARRRLKRVSDVAWRRWLAKVG